MHGGAARAPSWSRPVDAGPREIRGMSPGGRNAGKSRSTTGRNGGTELPPRPAGRMIRRPASLGPGTAATPEQPEAHDVAQERIRPSTPPSLVKLARRLASVSTGCPARARPGTRCRTRCRRSRRRLGRRPRRMRCRADPTGDHVGWAARRCSATGGQGADHVAGLAQRRRTVCRADRRAASRSFAQARPRTS